MQWICDWPEAKSQTFSLYQGETATFEPTFRVNGRTVTNATIEAVWYQTNGMANAWWKLDGATFAPSNDVGAAAYRFFVEAKASGDTIYRANGALRMLPSPGFTPNAIEPPVKTLDFATVDVLNPPWTDPDYSTNNTALVATIEATAPAPGNYAAVSNAAMNAAAATNDFLRTTGGTITGELAIGPNPNNSAKFETDPSGAMSLGLQDCIGNMLYITGGRLHYQRYDWQSGVDLYFPPTEGTFALDSDISTKQDNLPYPTNAIPYAAISGKPSLATVATSGSYNDLSNKPTIPTVPTNVSAFNNDAGYLTGYTESDPTISSWAKASSKPSYTASEVGAVPTSRTVNGKALSANISLTASDVGAATTGALNTLSSQVSAISGHLSAAIATNSAAALAATNYTDSATNSLSASLSSQLSRVSQSATNYTDSAIANADTTYRRYTVATNANQSVQYLQLDASQTDLSIELPTTGATKDWIIYVYAATNATLSLPQGVTWWTSDAANTNAIEAATPTALYFSQIAENIYLLGRQNLESIGGAQ